MTTQDRTLLADSTTSPDAAPGDGGLETDVAVWQDSEPAPSREIPIAKLRYRGGLEAEFTYEDESGELGFGQRGFAAETRPIDRSRLHGFLELFLAITPGDLPVPEELMSELEASPRLLEQARRRGLAYGCVVAELLDMPAEAGPTPRGNVTCTSGFYPWAHWTDWATPGLAPKDYYSSNFVGKARHSHSFIFNCVPAGSPSHLWARHRIYYKNVWGNYKYQGEQKIPPGAFDEITRGSIRRYRRVTYDDGWNSSPSNSSLKYTRQGRFDD